MNSLAGRKILLVITKSNWGGAQLYVYTLARNYQERGAEVLVAFGGTGKIGARTGTLADKLREAHISTKLLASFSRDISASHDAASLSELRALIKKERPDILHLNSSKAGGIGAFAGRLEGVPHIVFTAHGWAHREPRIFFKKFLIWVSSWLTIFLSHTVIVVSKKDYRDAPVLCSRKKLVLIRNGIGHFELRSREHARAHISETYSVPIAGAWLLMTSELHHNKGVDVAIKALPEVLTHYPETFLVVMGEGEDRNKLEALISDLALSEHVFLVGFVQEPRMYLKAGTVFLMPSRKEGLPFGLLEAGMAGLPVIATDIGGIPEIINSSKNGLLISSDSPSALSESICMLLADSKKTEELGKNLQKKIQTEFSEETMVTETIAVYSR
jgi:glycosyltransferase involved in cell wall biosynthesis